MDYKEKVIALLNSQELSKEQKEKLESIFPELKESEDERIRRQTLKVLNYYKDEEKSEGRIPTEIDECIAWLEKQGEHANFRNKIQVGDKVTRNKDGVLVNLSQLKRVAKPAEEYNITGIGSKHATGKLAEKIKELKPLNEILEKQGEQKPIEWTMDNVEELTEFENAMMHIGGSFFGQHAGLDPNDTNAIKEQANTLLEFVPKQEWSEEDDHNLQCCIDKIQYDIDNGRIGRNRELLAWLKSLKERYTWKPSERQKEALLWCVVHLGGADKQTLGELLEELNKL